MSTAQSLIDEFQKEYWNTLSVIKSVRHKLPDNKLTESDGRAVFERILAFQIFLETKEFQIKMFSGAAYFDRLSGHMTAILELVRSGKVLRTVTYQKKTGQYMSSYTDEIEGLSNEGRQFFDKCRREDDDRQLSSLKGMVGVLEDMDPLLILLAYDLRLVAGLISLPSDQRMKIKDDLIKRGFSESVGYLETAEQHMFANPPRPKDALSNCRLSLESMVHSLLKSQGIAPVNKFSIDLSTLSSKHPALIDDAIKQVIQATYGYLSLKGSHIYSTIDLKDMGPVEFGLEQTYRVLDQALLK